MLRSVLLCTAAATTLALSAKSQNVPTGFVIDTLISSGLQAGHDFCFLADGRVLIANRGGLVQVWAGTGAPVSVGTVPNVETSSEQGLLSIAADPAFATNGYIYVWNSSTLDTLMHLDRYTCTGDLSNPSSTTLTFNTATRRVVLTSTPDSAFNHNGGSLRFGPDGMLYLSIGDDAQGCPAQSTTSSLGCIMRMNVSTLPAGGSTTAPGPTALDPGNNPLSSNTDVSQLVIANGLRNPFRMEIYQVTGNLYIGDVGQNAVEEYDEYVFNAGGLTLVNYGWPWREGNSAYSTCSGSQPASTNPIIAISQAGSGWASVMGGPRYRNQGGVYDFGASYEGDAFYLDYFAGHVRRLHHNGTAWVAAATVPGQPDATNWGTNFTACCSMRQGPDGALYFLQHTGTYATSGGYFKRLRLLGPVNSVAAVSGGGQVVPANEPFPTPLVARVLDPNGQPLPGGSVNFAVTGGATLSTTNPVIADGQGLAQTTVTATNTGGAITVTASTPGGVSNGTFSLFARKLTVTPAGTLMVVSALNTTTAVPAQVPFVVMMSFPGSPILPSIVGPICTDPGYALTLVIEDGTGAFGGISFSGSGAIGTPSKTWLYQNVPTGLFTGMLMRFQAVGYDPVTGWFRTNCEQKQF
ncbi:MAG: PQQ-dependent sugar dehydrogenase [Planctomycetes bacterium]|nr:PQQ-dependent sugar dehydrogenase [Planctomycetota bacterium]